MNALEQVYTITEAAGKSGISNQTLHSRRLAGKLKCRKSAGTWLVLWTDVEDYKKSLTKAEK